MCHAAARCDSSAACTSPRVAVLGRRSKEAKTGSMQEDNRSSISCWRCNAHASRNRTVRSNARKGAISLSRSPDRPVLECTRARRLGPTRRVASSDACDRLECPRLFFIPCSRSDGSGTLKRTRDAPEGPLMLLPLAPAVAVAALLLLLLLLDPLLLRCASSDSSCTNAHAGITRGLCIMGME